MNKIQKTFEATMAEYVPRKVILHIIKDKCDEFGIKLNQEQLDYIESKLASISGNNLTIHFDDEQLKDSTIPKEIMSKGKLSIDLDHGGSADDVIEEIIEQFLSKLPDLISESTDLIFRTLKKDARKQLKHNKQRRSKFEYNLNKRWKKPFDLLELFLMVALEIGEEFNHEYRLAAAEHQDHVFEVLTRLHARSCQIGLEVLTLLRSGFADGAHARWRTLHEIAVTALFIAKYGDEVAYRYLCYDVVERYKAALLYQQYCTSLDYEPLSHEEMDGIKDKYEEMKDKFGSSFTKKYGWASQVVGKESPAFSEIEHFMTMAHMRPYYRLASHNVHANPRGVFFKLGLTSTKEDILLSGPSDIGFDEPASGTALSITQVTAALLGHEVNLDSVVEINILKKFKDEMDNYF